MPLVRFQVRNEFGLGRPELYGVVDGEEDPKAVLDGVSVAGFVGILRQLGDLAEFAADVFHGLQEQVMTTASRSQKLTSRARCLEAALPPLEKAVLSQTSHLHFAYTAGCEWHPHIHNKQNQFIYNDLPSFIMDSYEECRDPPRLHLLDKFDTGESGSCLKRYSDPTFFKGASGASVEANYEKILRYKKRHKSKRKSFSQRNKAMSSVVSMSSQTAWINHISPTDDGQATSQTASTVDMVFASNMQEEFDVREESNKLKQSDVREESDLRDQTDLRGQSETQGLSHVQEPFGMHEPSDMQDQLNSCDHADGSGYIEYLLNQSPVTKPKERVSVEVSSRSMQRADTICYVLPNEPLGSGDDNVPCSSSEAWNGKAEVAGTKEQAYIQDEASDMLETNFGPDTPERGMSHLRSADRENIQFDEEDSLEKTRRRNQLSGSDRPPESKSESEITGEREIIVESEILSELGSESGIGSEADDFVDALNTIEPESENELENQKNQQVEQSFKEADNHGSAEVYGCNLNVDRSEDVFACNDYHKRSDDVQHKHATQSSDQHHVLHESRDISCIPENEDLSCVLLDPVPKQTIPDEKNTQDSINSEGFGFHENNCCLYSSNEESVAISPLLVEAIAGEKILSEESVAICPSMVQAIPGEKILPEESVATSPSLVEAIPGERILPEESVAIYPSLVEAIPGEKSHHEESVAISPSMAEAIPSEKILQDETFATSPSLVEAVPSEKILQEESFFTSLSLVEAITGEKILLEESEAASPSMAEAIPDESILQQKSVAVSRSRVEAIPDEKILQDETFTASLSSVEAVPGGQILQEESFVTSPLSVEAIPYEKIFQEESVAVSPSLAEAPPGGKILEEKSVAISRSSVEAFLGEKILREESAAVSSSFLEAFPGEQILLEESVAVSPSLVEAAPGEKILLEESAAICPPLIEAFPDEKILREESVITCCQGHDQSIAESHCASDIPEIGRHSCGLPDPVLTENVPDEKISQVLAYDLPSNGLHANGDDTENSPKGEPHATFPSVSTTGNRVSDSQNLSTNGTVSSFHEPQESVSKDSCFQPVTIWTNGNLLGLEPSKPPVFAVPNPSNQDSISKNEFEPGENTGGFQNFQCSNDEKVSAASYAVLEAAKSSHTNGPNEQNREFSYGVFGLSHRLLLNGFGRKAEGPTKENRKLCGQEASDESLFGSPPSSPPVEHMKISFNPLNGLDGSGLKLKFPWDSSDAFASFQLVPEIASFHEIASESENDTFCRSSPYISDDCLSNHSELDSVRWESDERPEQRDHELYENGAETSLSGSVLDLPCFDALNAYPPVETQEICEWKILQKQLIASDFLSHDSDQKNAVSTGFTRPQVPLASAKQSNDDEAAVRMPDSKVQQKMNPEKDADENCKDMNKEQNSSRRVDTAKPTFGSAQPANATINMILEKANAIRQIVENDDDHDTWSDT